MSGREHTAKEPGNRKKKSARPQRRRLENREGRSLTVTLREYRPGDEEGMIACIRDEYGDTYFKRELYRPEYIQEEAVNGHTTFLTAQTKAGEIAGMMILKEFSPRESMCEIASQIFRKKYRGYGLAMPFFEYGLQILLDGDYSAAYSLPVMFHDTTQRLLYRLGMRATGFVLNVFDMTHITHSYKNGRNRKHSQGIQIRAAGKRDAGILYLPEEHRDFCRGIYEKLGVSYCMAPEAEGGSSIPPDSELSYKQDDRQSSLEIRIFRIGLDLPERMSELHKIVPFKDRQTANVFLNISDKNAVWAYRSLTDMGYFFTGLKPLCSEKEYMVLHNPGEIKIYLKDYVLSKEFSEIADYLTKKGNINRINRLGGSDNETQT